jgi:endonuclease/exonuclease/phosphatase family metal-dependent hydrolase
MRQQKKGWKKVLKWLGIVVLAIVLAVVVFFGVLTVTEYKPQDVEALEVNGSCSKTISQGDSLTIMTWNVGYGALGEDADFFMDGGTHVITATAEEVEENLDYCLETVHTVNPDVVFFQEVDTDAKRSHGIDEEQILSEGMSGYKNTFAYNYKSLYVPYPLPTIGKVNAGIMTFSSYDITSSERIQLPCPFSYPVRLCNLKRCLMVNRVPIEGSDKELVLVNLHLEAYDDGEGKAAQTAMLNSILQTEVEAGNYVIAGGDFNQTFSNVDTSMYPVISEDMWTAGKIDVEDFDDSLQFVADNSTPTCRSLDQPYAGSDKDNFQYYMIDGFIVSSNLKVETVETMDTGFVSTDHNPVVMTVTLQ